MFSKYDFRVIRTLRRRQGLTMEQLAQKSGLTYPTVATIETNKSLPSMKTLDALAGVLHFSASNLLALSERRVVQIRQAHRPKKSKGAKDHFDYNRLKIAHFDQSKLFRVQGQAGEEIKVAQLNEDIHELCYVLTGAVELRIEGDLYPLHRDDALLFDGILDHSYRMLESGEFITVHIAKNVGLIETLLARINGSSEKIKKSVK